MALSFAQNPTGHSNKPKKRSTATSPDIQSTPAPRTEDGRGKTTNQKRAEAMAMAHETAHLTEGLTNKKQTKQKNLPWTLRPHGIQLLHNFKQQANRPFGNAEGGL
jgi:hypothetical protein